MDGSEEHCLRGQGAEVSLNEDSSELTTFNTNFDLCGTFRRQFRKVLSSIQNGRRKKNNNNRKTLRTKI